MSFIPLEGVRGVRMDGHTDTCVPAEATLRPVHDNLIVQPLDVTYSRLIHVMRQTQPLRGLVLAAGPGHYPIKYRYRHDDKTGKRQKIAAIHSGKRRPIVVTPGDIVELGGSERGGYSWESFYWGDRLVVKCTERDVAGVTGHICLTCGLSACNHGVGEPRDWLPNSLAARAASECAGLSGRQLSRQPTRSAVGTRA